MTIGLASLLALSLSGSLALAQTAQPAAPNRPQPAPAPAPAAQAQTAPAQPAAPARPTPAPAATQAPVATPAPAAAPPAAAAPAAAAAKAPPESGMTGVQAVGGMNCLIFGSLTAAGVYVYSDVLMLAVTGYVQPALLLPTMAAGFAMGCTVGNTMTPGLMYLSSLLF